MIEQLLKHPLSVATGVIIIVLILITTQSNPPYLFIFPILLLTLGISWYLHKEFQRDHEENLKRGIRYATEEQDAQQWLHTTFVPKVRSLSKKNMRNIIVASSSILLSFIFIWSFFVTGLLTALLNTFIGLVLFLLFMAYALSAPKEFTHILRHVPKRFQKYTNNDWVHGYLLLFPLTIIGFLMYSITTSGGDIIRTVLTLPSFLFFYSLLFVCLYCIWYLYDEYQKDGEKSRKKAAKKILEDKEA